jgi:hypothetical protein
MRYTRRSRVRQRWTWIAAIVLAGCGGSEVAPNTPDDEPASGQRSGDDDDMPMLSVGGTIGGLDKQEVQSVIQKAWPDVSRCIRKGRKQLAFLGGEVGIAITVGSNGRAVEVFLHDSTLGDHEVEACVVKAFRSKQWPRPVGGELGKVDQTFDFTAGHTEPPLDWDADTLESGMAKEAEGDEKPYEELLTTLNACRSDAKAGPLRVTMYLDEDGFVQAVGMGMADARGQKAVDCVVTTMKTTSFPAPEDNFAKVTVDVK